MRKTQDGYLIPECDEEDAEAIEHNTTKSANDFRKLTNEQQIQWVKDQKKRDNQAPKGFSRGALKLDNYMDNVQQFWNIQQFFYDKSQMFWIWNKQEYRYEMTDEVNMMILIDQELSFGGQTVTSKVKGNYLEAFKRVGRIHTPQDAPKEWIQFKNTIVDIKSGEQRTATSKYFMTNPIPWNIGTNEETPIMDKLFSDWQGENKNILYEILSYCLISDYPIHTVVAMIGSGRNGKTQFQLITERLLGKDNITSTELDTLLENRFESAKLYKKLVCTMGETNFGVINKTSLLKKLCGGDLIGYEFKNKMPFTGHNYAKIIISTNSLPPSTDTTEGFYRRWLILNWNNCFKEGKDIIDTIPIQEYENLCLKLIRVLKELLERGNFTTQGSIEERKIRYILASNPITLFFDECCNVGDKYFVKAKDLYHSYLKYLEKHKRRSIKRKEFNQILAEEGYQPEHKDKHLGENDESGYKIYEKSYWIEGLELKSEISLIPPISPCFATSTLHDTAESKNHREIRENGEKSFDKILLPCSLCDAPPPCTLVDAKGHPVCEICAMRIKEENIC